MLYISDFSKSYGPITVLTIKNLAFGPGIYWIKGENGTGKTSLFKSIAGILPSTGEISLDDVNLKRHAVDFRMRVNYSEAEPLYPGFATAKDLIRFIGTAKKASVQQQEDLKAAFGISAFAAQACSTYSSGMLKKVSLAAAFLGSPSVIILDEPFITIDTKTKDTLTSLIKHALGQDVTFLISSHQSLEEDNLPVSATYAIRNKTLEVD
jgi:ABC-2 type transport system ATP-binding protein